MGCESTHDPRPSTRTGSGGDRIGRRPRGTCGAWPIARSGWLSRSGSVDVPAMRWVGPGASPVDHADSQPAVTSRKEPRDSGFSASIMRRRYGSAGDAPGPTRRRALDSRSGLAGDGEAVAAVVVLVDPGRAFREAGRAGAGE